ADMLGGVTPDGFPGPIYVSFGNETHMANEWADEKDPSSEYGRYFRDFVQAMSIKLNRSSYVLGHAAVNLSFPPGEIGEGWSSEEGPGDRAERFYSSVTGKGAGSFSGSRVLFSNPYELGSVPFPDDPGIPGTAYRAGTALNIPEHIDIDRHYNAQQGGSNSPNIWMEFGKRPGAPIGERQAFLEQAYATDKRDYKGLDPKFITPMLMSDIEKYIVVFKDESIGGGVAYIQCTDSSCGDEICAGGLASNNPPVPPLVVGDPGALDLPPICPSGNMSLKIKGTIKSSDDFAIQRNELTNETEFINRKNIPEDQWVNYTFTNNQPINGAIVAIYPSYAFSGSDAFGNTHEYSPGKLGGKLHSSTRVNFVRTKSDGNFEITATKTGTEVCDLGGWKQYLTVICPEKVNGTVKTIVKDLYAFPLNKTNGEVVLRDINVACDIDLTKNGRPKPPTSLEYVARDPNKFLACSDWG
ncbi:hypothetical protein COT50_00525, partial [candidate division WWE3 bacterium CG08_land_8_20_14_0_20_41_10]